MLSKFFHKLQIFSVEQGSVFYEFFDFSIVFFTINKILVFYNAYIYWVE